MSRFSLIPLDSIQLFAQDGAAGTGGQETAAFAQPQTGDTRSSAPTGREEGTPDAGESRNAAADREARFESLIKGEYKDLYDRRVQDTIQKRLKGSAGIVQKYNALAPSLELLGQRYGVDASDPEALRRAIQAENAPTSEGEEKSGASEQAESLRQERAKRQLSDWLHQAEVTRSRYPSFDLQQEARDPRFRSLLRSGVPLQTAFEEDGAACVGLYRLVVGIEINHVAAAEIGEKVHALVRHGERQCVADPLAGDRLRVAVFVDHLRLGEPCIDVSGLFLLCQRHVPKVRHTVARTFHNPDACEDVLTDDKLCHATVVSAFQGRDCLQRSNEAQQLWPEVSLVEMTAEVCTVECLLGELRQNVLYAVLCHVKLQGYGFVAEAERPVDEFHERRDVQQSVG